MDLTIFSAFLAGFLSTLTPCVYPLIPITLSIIKADLNAGRISALINSSLYSFGIFISYTLLGLIAVYSGGLFGEIWASESVRFILGLFLIILAFYSCEIFKFKADGFLTSLSSKLSSKPSYSKISAGLVSGIFAAPCTGPLLAAILAFAASSQDKTRGILLLVFYAFGFSVPFILLSFFPELLKRIPRSGQWLHAVKYIIASFLLAFGFEYLGFLNSAPLFLFKLTDLKLLLTIFSCFFLISLILYLKLRKKEKLYLNLLSIIISGIFLFICLQGIKKNQQIKFAAIFKDSKLSPDDKRPKILFFSAEWCVKCHELKNIMASNQNLTEKLSYFHIIEVDFTQMSEEDRQLQAKYSVRGLPNIIFTCPDFTELKTDRITDTKNAEQLLEIIEKGKFAVQKCLTD